MEHYKISKGSFFGKWKCHQDRSRGEFSNYYDSQFLVYIKSSPGSFRYCVWYVGCWGLHWWQSHKQCLTICGQLLTFIIEGNAEFQLDVKNRDYLFPFKFMVTPVKSPYPKEGIFRQPNDLSLGEENQFWLVRCLTSDCSSNHFIKKIPKESFS